MFSLGLFVVVLHHQQKFKFHHQAFLYLITMKPCDIITQPTNHIVYNQSTLKLNHFIINLFKSVGGTTKSHWDVRVLHD